MHIGTVAAFHAIHITEAIAATCRQLWCMRCIAAVAPQNLRGSIKDSFGSQVNGLVEVDAGVGGWATVQTRAKGQGPRGTRRTRSADSSETWQPS